MDIAIETQLRFFSSVIGVVLIAALVFVPTLNQKRAAIYVCIGVALLGLLNFYNFGFFRQYEDRGFVNLHEQFHYHLGPKYFPELGYSGLYLASLAAQLEADPDSEPGSIMRDLSSNSRIPVRATLQTREAVVSGFSPERWAEFGLDQRYYLDEGGRDLIRRVRMDHGYNASPAYTFVSRTLFSGLGAGRGESIFIASVDIILMLITFWVVYRTYGLRVTCLSIGLLGLSFGWRYIYVGAALRLDWLAAVMCAVCALHRGRSFLGGALLGYATIVRIFPLLLMAGPLVLAVRAVARGERPSWPLRLAGGFAGVVLLGLIAGSATGRGPEAWVEFADNMVLHWRLTPWTRVGLDVLHQIDLERFWESLRGIHPSRGLQMSPVPILSVGVGLLLKAIFVGLFVAAVWKSSLSEAVVMGVALIFAITAAGAYYWIMLIAMPLVRERAALLGPVLLAAGLYLHLIFYPAHAIGPARYVLLSAGLAIVFSAWLLLQSRSAMGEKAVGSGCT